MASPDDRSPAPRPPSGTVHSELGGDLSVVVGSLHRAYDGRLGATAVEAEIQQVADGFTGARIRAFVPLLVRRYAGARLRGLPAGPMPAPGAAARPLPAVPGPSGAGRVEVPRVEVPGVEVAGVEVAGVEVAGVEVPGGPEGAHAQEPHGAGIGARLNTLRAGVLGANDGIVSVAGLVAGMAGATTDRATIVTAGVAGLVAGALSMAGGEFVSVSTQRDTELALLSKERAELADLPEAELAELVGLYRDKGLSSELARQVAIELTARDPLAAHADAELRIDPQALTDPWRAAWVSMAAFSGGALLPLVVVLLMAPGWRVPVCFVAVALVLAVTGSVSARLGGAPRGPAVLRNVGVGVLAMVVTYGAGVGVGRLT